MVLSGARTLRHGRRGSCGLTAGYRRRSSDGTDTLGTRFRSLGISIGLSPTQQSSCIVRSDFQYVPELDFSHW
jgi:hypothetical protein